MAIARALAGDPQVVLVDEPTGNLDTKLSVEIMELLQHLNAGEGPTIIMVTHERGMADYAHRLIWMIDGKVESDRSTAKGAA